MATTTDLTTLKINYLTQAQYDNALTNNQINSNELYLTPSSSSGATDEKVKAVAATDSTTYYLVMGSNSGLAETKQYDTRLNYKYASNTATLSIGSTSDSGYIKVYDSTSGYENTLSTVQLTAARSISLPDKSGTVALTSEVPSIKLNNSSTTTPNFYAPTSVGTSGQYLKSNGSGAPSWTSLTIPTITLNGSSTTSPSFYAPTSAGTNNYVLKSNGSGAPSWTSATLTDTMVTTAENTKSTKYYPILATGTGTDTRQIDTNDKNDSSATASGLWYQNGFLCTPSLQVGDVDYTITTSEYSTLTTSLNNIV